MKFFPGDFIKDTRGLSPSTKGIWIDLICFVWGNEPRGQITAEFDSLRRMLGCSEDELNRALSEFINHKVCEVVTESNGFVTVISRRIKREEKNRENTKLRVERFREKQECNAPSNASVTPKKPEAIFQKPEERKEIKAESPVDNSIIEQIAEIGEKLYKLKIFPEVNAWINSQKKKNKNNKAILHCLESCLKNKPKDPWPWSNSAMRIENQNYNEQDHISESNKYKQEPSQISNIFKKIGETK